MELIIILVVGAAFELVVQIMRESGSAASSGPEQPRTLGRQAHTCTIQPTDDGVCFNPGGRLPIELVGVAQDDVAWLPAAITDYTSPPRIKERLGLLIAQYNAHSQEVEAFLTEVRKRYDSALQKELDRHPNHTQWPDRDRQDFIHEAREKAVDEINVCCHFEDIEILMTDRPADVTADDEITKHFGTDVDGLRAYLRACERSHGVEARDREERETFERLAQMGLVQRGTEMPLESLLQQVRVKDIMGLLGEDAPKRFQRKADAVAYAAEIEDMRERFAEHHGLRSRFQASNPGAKAQAAAQAFRYATEYAGLIVTTLITEARANRDYEHAKRFAVVADECAWCNKYADREFTRRAQKAKPPHHVGCTCVYEPVVDD